MLKKLVTYRDYEDNVRTDTLYFHLNRFEWLELETYTKGGLMENLQHAIETNNAKKTIDLLKKIILKAYGEKDPETGAFEKDDNRAIRFSKTDAFSTLFYELAYDEKASKEFFIGLIPKELRDDVMKKMNETLPPKESAEIIPIQGNK